MKSLLAGLLLLAPSLAGASGDPFNMCYAQAQVAHDTRVNALLGLPVNHVFQMQPAEPYFSIMLAAYLTIISPQDYSLRVYSICMGGGVDA